MNDKKYFEKGKTKSNKTKIASMKTNPNKKKSEEIVKHIIWMERKGLVKVNKNLEGIVKVKINEKRFEPSMKVLMRIIDSIIRNGSENKTSLSRGANLNYARLAKHVVWMEKKGLVESGVKNSKIAIMLTDKGRLFASTIME